MFSIIKKIRYASNVIKRYVKTMKKKEYRIIYRTID